MCCERKGRVPEIAVAVGSVMSPRTARGGVSGGVRARSLRRACSLSPAREIRSVHPSSLHTSKLDSGLSGIGERSAQRERGERRTEAWCKSPSGMCGARGH